jgi:FtsP/CotA-like multicopper oxidase with cupredoxin domain
MQFDAREFHAHHHSRRRPSKGNEMRLIAKRLLSLAIGGVAWLSAGAQCPARPSSGTVVQDPASIASTNGVLAAKFVMQRSVDTTGYTHYCYKYSNNAQTVEAPTLRLNPGDRLRLDVENRIKGAESTSTKMEGMAEADSAACGDGGAMTVDSTNVHFHGLNVPPKCHQDDVIHTLIQPGTPAFQYDLQIPATEQPGLYWYHPHVHGFTEFQVNGGAAGALIVEGIEKVRPEVKGLTERVFVIRQQYLVPWIPGPYQLTINYQVAQAIGGAKPVIQMKPGERQFWRVVNATIQDFLPLQVRVDGKPIALEVIALDGYPVAKTRTQETILVPPAGRAEFIVHAPAQAGAMDFFTGAYSTGPTGNADVQQTLAAIQLVGNASAAQTSPAASAEQESSAGTDNPAVTATRKLFFSEEFGGTNGPIQFYITVDGQKQKVFEGNEKPVIVTKVGAVEDWTVENRALETHAFHMHQIHFRVLEIDGKPIAHQDLKDTVEIPYWDGKGPFHSVKLRMDFRDPNTAGTFVFHCHVLLHEDLGMMHKILVEP